MSHRPHNCNDCAFRFVIDGNSQLSPFHHRSSLPSPSAGRLRFFAKRRKDQYPVEVIFTQHNITRHDGEPGTMWRVERVADEPEAFKEVPW